MTLFADIQQQVVTNCGGRDNDGFLLSIKFNTNAVLTWLATQAEWPELQRTAEPLMVIGQTSYTKAELGITSLNRLYGIKLFDGVDWRPPMQYLTKVRFDSEVKPYSTTISGKPEVYTVFGGKYVFNLKPDATYLLNLDYYAHPTLVTGDTSEIPYERLDGPLANLLSGYGWLSIGDSSMAEAWFKAGSAQLKAIGIDTTSLLNLRVAPRNEVSNSSQPWTDPFQRR